MPNKFNFRFTFRWSDAYVLGAAVLYGVFRGGFDLTQGLIHFCAISSIALIVRLCIEPVLRPQIEVYEDAYEDAYNKGLREGLRRGRPVVIPIRPDLPAASGE